MGSGSRVARANGLRACAKRVSGLGGNMGCCMQTCTGGIGNATCDPIARFAARLGDTPRIRSLAVDVVGSSGIAIRTAVAGAKKLDVLEGNFM